MESPDEFLHNPLTLQAGIVPNCDRIAELTGGAVRPPCGGLEMLPTVFSGFVGLAMMAAIVLCFIFLLFGGIRWIISMGDKDKVSQARSTLVNAVIGLAIVLSSVAIMTVVGKILGFDFQNLSIPSL